MTMKRMIRAVPAVLISILLLVVADVDGAQTLIEKCNNDFTKVATCLTFATGKAETPTKECCTSVTEIKQGEPECLCFFIQQTHSGSEQVKNLGIQESRLLQLPSACKLTNASVSDCPKLLNIPPTSPDYAIFTNSSATTSPSTVTGPGSPTVAGISSGTTGTKHAPQLVGLVAIAVAIFSCVPPVEVVSTFYTRG